MRLVNSQQSRALDSLSEQFGVTVTQLMEKAGLAVADFVQQQSQPKEGAILIFAGKGNNGGDARVAAKHLQQKGYQTVLIQNESDFEKLKKEKLSISWIVDGLLGTGIKGEVRDWIRSAIEWINEEQSKGKKVLAIDIPSGLSADKGFPLGVAVRATCTLCLADIKLGVVLSPGCDYAGKVMCADIGIPKEAYAKVSCPYHLLGPSDFPEVFKPRRSDTSKKDFGHVLVVAGSRGMPGAGFLAAMGALRSGAGLVTYALPAKAFEKFDPAFAEVMVKEIPDDAKGFFTPASVDAVLKECEKKNALLLGPGLGRSPETMQFVEAILNRVALPVILDADGLYAIQNSPRILRQRKAPTLLTPHPGEMAALLGWQTEEVQKGRIAAAVDAAKLWHASLVLKGFRSLIALPTGDLYVNPTGNPGMATAGTGDVLSGIVAGFAAQGIPPEKALLAGVYLHGFAGDMAREELGEKGLIASDILRYLPPALKLAGYGKD